MTPSRIRARLSTARWRAVLPYLDEALDLTEEQRAPWLASRRAEDPALADDLEALLQKHDSLAEQGFLARTPALLTPRPSLAGQVIGAYTLQSQIGQGGMGSVWLAERSDGRFQGVAAVKLLNASLAGRDGEARFRREGSILARLRHPHIANLIDAGVSPQGQPYLVLERVDGERIDRYCDARKLDVQARIRLFLDVLAAVSHAHASLVVHRDLKPSNVLVGTDGQVKLLDFGIAKLLESQAGDEVAALTRDGESLLTPEYAAPEQLTGGDVTTATDVYSLGVLVYVLLTGRHPAGGGISSPAALIRAVMDSDPARPSDAVGMERHAGDGPAENAAHRATTPKKLRGSLRGDLDNIVAKALKKRPSERYASAEAMAEDLRRFLALEPVSAGADSLAYRAGKYVRRHRGGVAAATVVIAVLVLGTAGVAWQAREARKQRDEAQAQLARATAANDFMNVLLNVAAPVGRKFEVGELLDQGALLIDKQFASDESLRAEMLSAVGANLLSTEHLDRAESILETSAALARRSGDPALKARALCPLAALHAEKGERAVGEALLAEALGGLPDEPRYALPRAGCLVNRSSFGYYSGEAEPMIRSASAALELLDRTPAPARLMRIDALGAVAYGHYLARHTHDAEAAYVRLWDTLVETGLERTSFAATALNNWSLVHFWGDISRAETLCRRSVELRRAIESSESILPTATFNHAGALLQLARYDEAERLFEETIATAGARGEDRIRLDAMMELAEVYIEKGDLGRASAQLAKLQPVENTPKFDPWRQQQLAYYRARLALARRDYAEALARFTEVAYRFEKRQSKISMNAMTLIGLARTQQALGHRAEALASAQRATALSESFVEKDSPSYLIGLACLAEADIHRTNGEEGAAQASYRRALDHLQRTLGADHPATVAARQNILTALTAQAGTEGARPPD
jgi:serine/threonine protein kinase